MPDKPLADFMVERGYIGRDVPLMKRVMGLAGQRVCRTGNAITVDACRLACARPRPARPSAAGLAGLPPHRRRQIFLMNPDVRDSLDGRYFGPIPARGVIGKATPLYTDEAAMAASSGAPPRADRFRSTGAVPADGLPNTTAMETSCRRSVNSRARRPASRTHRDIHALPRHRHRARRSVRCGERAGLSHPCPR
jgi:hypothetical protein